MYSTLVISENFVTCMMLESYLKKNGITNIYQTNSIPKLLDYLSTESADQLYIDMESVFTYDQNFQKLLEKAADTQIVFVGDKDYSSMDFSFLSREPGFIKSVFPLEFREAPSPIDNHHN